MYFNKKYKRVGHLYQGVYRAVSVKNEEQYLYLTKYIHQQSLASKGLTLQDQPSSYEDYLELRNTEWVKPKEILSCFFKTNSRLSYKSFIEEGNDFGIIQHFIIDKE